MADSLVYAENSCVVASRVPGAVAVDERNGGAVDPSIEGKIRLAIAQHVSNVFVVVVEGNHKLRSKLMLKSKAETARVRRIEAGIHQRGVCGRHQQRKGKSAVWTPTPESRLLRDSDAG